MESDQNSMNVKEKYYKKHPSLHVYGLDGIRDLVNRQNSGFGGILERDLAEKLRDFDKNHG